jgi:hypothetical protein
MSSDSEPTKCSILQKQFLFNRARLSLWESAGPFPVVGVWHAYYILSLGHRELGKIVRCMAEYFAVGKVLDKRTEMVSC